MTAPRAFLFDMGNVLVHFSHERMCAQVGRLCGLTADQMKAILFDSRLQWDFERGKLTEAEFHTRLQHDTGRTLDLAALRLAGSDIFELNHSILPLLAELKARGHRLVLLSNTSTSHFQFVWERFEVLQLFDEFVTSYRVGAVKPEPAIFEAALEAIDCDPQSCFYTDDIEAYVTVGRTFGLQAEVFTDTANLLGQLAARGLVLNLATR